MEREDFKKIIKIWSEWKIDKREGNYRLPNGSHLSDYLQEIVTRFLNDNKKAFTQNGDLEDIVESDGEKVIELSFIENEKFDRDEQDIRIAKFVCEII